MSKINGRWFSPVSWFYLPTDWNLAVRWGKADAAVPDPESQEMALGSSLCLLHPLTHHRYWAAYRAAGGEIES